MVNLPEDRRHGIEEKIEQSVHEHHVEANDLNDQLSEKEDEWTCKCLLEQHFPTVAPRLLSKKNPGNRSIHLLSVRTGVYRSDFQWLAPFFRITEGFSDHLRLALQQNGCIRYDQEWLVTLRHVGFEIRTLFQVQ